MSRRPSIHPVELMTYADGLINSDTRRRSELEEHLRADPNAAARVAEYVSQNREIRVRYSGVLDEPVPAHLLDLVQDRWTNFRLPTAVRIGIATAAIALTLFAVTRALRTQSPAGKLPNFPTLDTSTSPSRGHVSGRTILARDGSAQGVGTLKVITLRIHPPRLNGYRLIPYKPEIPGYNALGFSYVAPGGRRLRFFVGFRRAQRPVASHATGKNAPSVYSPEGQLVCGVNGNIPRDKLLTLARKVCVSTMRGLVNPRHSAEKLRVVSHSEPSDKALTMPGASAFPSHGLIATAEIGKPRAAGLAANINPSATHAAVRKSH